jgi:hypothetical protein
MIDLICCVAAIHNGDKRINKLKQKLCSLVSTAKIQEKNEQQANDILKTIFSSNDEFLIGCMLHKLHPSLEFATKGGPDFRLGDLGIKVEAKSKLNRTYVGDYSVRSDHLFEAFIERRL